MCIREATPNDNYELQNIQSKCPMGASLVVSTVNTPDFFARAKAYEKYKVFVSCDNSCITGSAALAIREVVINGNVRRAGYEFQYFTSPDYRRQGVARLLHRHIEDYFTKEEVALSFLIIMEGNIPSIRFFESQGFKLHRSLVMPVVFVYIDVEIPSIGHIRSITSRDMEAVAELLNETWKGYDFYEPHTSESLSQFIDRIPAFTYDDLVILEDHGEVVACLGYWDWSQITQLTVKALSLRLHMIKCIVYLASLFRPMPLLPKPGTQLKQWCLTSIAYKTSNDLATLLRHTNNLAMEREVDQIFCVCESDHEIFSALKGLFHVNVGVHLYVKLFDKTLDSNDPVFINGIDL